jgi:channel protein (hemolysin III family)
MRETYTFLGLYDPVSAWLHLIAASYFLLAGYFLVNKGKGSKLRIFSLCVYTFSLVFLFSMSGVFHLLPYNTTARDVLQILDHSAIWVLIAGTFVPIHTIMFRGIKRWGILLIVWLITIPGIILTTVFFSSMPEWLSLSFYLGLGWIGVFTAYLLIHQYGFEKAKYIFYGGVAYTIGAIFEFLRWPVLIDGIIEPHEIFHVFVILGALYHWLFVYDHADWPIYDKQIFIVHYNSAKNNYKAYAKSDDVFIEATSIESLKEKIHALFEIKYKDKIPVEAIELHLFEVEEITQKIAP